jgi:tripartite ATP-independent transporter DctM subunit
VAAAYALLISAGLYRGVTLGNLREIMLSSVKSSASVGLVIGGALILNYVVASENVPRELAEAMKGMEVSPWVFMLAINVLLLALGCILDATTIILVIIPLFVQSAAAVGIDPIHFGVVVVVNCMIGLITPPYGVLLFVINGTTGISLREMIVEIWPFLIALLVALALIVVFPQIVLFLPSLFGYKAAG